jgi:hypothetical protein
VKKKPKKIKRPRKEAGPSYFAEKLSGLAEAARKLQREEQLLLNFEPKGSKFSKSSPYHSHL